MKKLHVVSVITNPIQYKSRHELFDKFKSIMEHNHHIVFHIVECAFGHRPFYFTEANNPNHLQLKTVNEIWLKENLINLMVQRFPSDWKYMAWVDGDLEFMDPDWAQKTVEQLQHYQVVQMFQTAIDMGPHGQVMNTFRGFAYSYLTDLPFKRDYGNWHPGFCWAFTKEGFNGVGGMLDFAVLGAGDDHMAKCLIGRGKDSLPHKINPNYARLVLNWEKNAESSIKRDIGYVQGTIKHHWHGKKVDRKYWSRWNIVVDNKFDPELDLKKDWQGVYQLTDRNISLRDDIRWYLRARHEDSIDIS